MKIYQIHTSNYCLLYKIIEFLVFVSYLKGKLNYGIMNLRLCCLIKIIGSISYFNKRKDEDFIIKTSVLFMQFLIFSDNFEEEGNFLCNLIIILYTKSNRHIKQFII
jgi:hypothetical protein